jgi:methylase of polypeptide subunit release factors
MNMETGPHNILGLEINEFAAELARVTVWIGDIQWCRQNGYPHAINPILKPLDGIEHRDALLNPDGSEAAWPAADVIVGNPPFLGDKVACAANSARDYVERCASVTTRVPGGADLVTYWFEKAAQTDRSRLCEQPGSSQPTRSAAAPTARCWIASSLTTRIFEAWSDEGVGQ